MLIREGGKVLGGEGLAGGLSAIVELYRWIEVLE